jgi:hypothetical protein
MTLLRMPPAMLVATVAVAAGCTPHILLHENENDRLRARTVELEDQAAALQQRNGELEAELARDAATSGEASEEIQAASPHVVEIAVQRLSHARDTVGDGVADELIVYIRPADGRGRFIQLLGMLSINAAILPADADAVTIGRVQLSPLQVRDAYRSGITGTHYTVSMPIEIGPGGEDSCVVRAVFEDARSRRTIAGERTIGLRP